MSSRRPRVSGNGPEPRLPACPAHLQGEARKEWKRMGKRLLECGLMTELDGAALALYCQSWARWVEAEANLVKYGTVMKSPSGFPIQSPYLAIANKAMGQMTRLLVEFGMSPSSRTRVSISRPVVAPTPTTYESPYDEPDPRRLIYLEQERQRTGQTSRDRGAGSEASE
jgi:P27 family predicted phage terminase small subunit